MTPLLSMSALVSLVGLAWIFSVAWARARRRREEAARRLAEQADRRQPVGATKAIIRRSLAAKALAREFPVADELDDWFESVPDTLRSGERKPSDG